MLEVSRTTVREALQGLQASGYVTTRRGRGGGTFVRTGRGPDSDEMIRRTLVPAWANLSEILDLRRGRRDAGRAGAQYQPSCTSWIQAKRGFP
jgi:DNA-binding FadR family transcriptional regulator